jgi:hypothetical protein
VIPTSDDLKQISNQDLGMLHGRVLAETARRRMANVAKVLDVIAEAYRPKEHKR